MQTGKRKGISKQTHRDLDWQTRKTYRQADKERQMTCRQTETLPGVGTDRRSRTGRVTPVEPVLKGRIQIRNDLTKNPDPQH
jgi:hypothetical protein